ncbi:hypothetical protein BWD42_02045 [Sphingobacterium sp. CZ-UAM]|uniref:hypothetical protein n=1 Tax=Sphingobacterium sp. CZ-UAM TaxID=1933868 RepID=UPI0009840A92|nr:hypothetical protein [Sphingobacterium sp. CZ-UAM]OOG18766.1 hypothetical protein BWD42_02045 [Sphingobacterium sp. CZ-UAM]
MTFLYRYIRLTLLLAALILSVDVFAQKQSSVDSNAVAFQFVDRLLSEGHYTAAVLGIPRPNASQLAIVEKMKLAIKDNEDWFLHVMKELEPGQPIPYHKNLGISEAEYAAFMQFSQSVKMDKLGAIALKVIHRDSAVYFEPKDFGDYLKYLVIHLKDHTVMVDSLRLLYKGQITMDAKKTTLVAGPWTGYSWQLEEYRKDGQLIADQNKADPTQMDIKSIKLVIGKLDHSDQCFVYLKSDIVNKGHVLAKQDIALLLTKE